MGSKREDKMVSHSPGPGVYDADLSANKDRVISYKMSQSTRNDIVSK